MSKPGSQDWLDSITEDIIDPEQRIIDPHHHLWRHPGNEYVVENLHADLGSGHNVVKTVFVECHAEYLKGGPEYLRPLGETRFVAEQAKESAERGGAKISGIVAHADLTLGDELKFLPDMRSLAMVYSEASVTPGPLPHTLKSCLFLVARQKGFMLIKNLEPVSAYSAARATATTLGIIIIRTKISMH